MLKIAVFLSAFGLSLVMGRFFVRYAAQFFKAKARQWTPQTHQIKNNTPTMGGIFIVLSAVITTLFCVKLSNPLVLVGLLCLLTFAAIGAWDDWGKVCYKKGISARSKFIAQIGASCLVVIAWFYVVGPSTTVFIPLLGVIDLGLLFIPWAVFIMIATSNAVNLTDGLDGLAASTLSPNFIVFGLIATYSQVAFVPELALLCTSLCGALLGFLWYNRYPAKVFMGDVGSLALGATLGFMALATHQEFLLVLTGIIFVAETVSVMLQVCAFRYFKKRIFKMTPIHHHFELIGWPETKITFWFFMITLVCSCVALIFFKISLH